LCITAHDLANRHGNFGYSTPVVFGDLLAILKITYNKLAKNKNSSLLCTTFRDEEKDIKH
jgi:hypothetical protein